MTETPAPTPAPTVRPAAWLPWLLILAVGTLLCQLCSVVPFIGAFAAAVFGIVYGPAWALNAQTSNGSPTVSAETAHVIDAYLDAMARGDATGAYALYSSETQALVTLEELERVLAGPDFAQYAGYRAVTIEDVSTEGPAARPRWAWVSGRVIYTGDAVGTYEALLEREHGKWRLSGLTLYPPPEKLGPNGAPNHTGPVALTWPVVFTT